MRMGAISSFIALSCGVVRQWSRRAKCADRNMVEADEKSSKGIFLRVIWIFSIHGVKVALLGSDPPQSRSKLGS